MELLFTYLELLVLKNSRKIQAWNQYYKDKQVNGKMEEETFILCSKVFFY